MSNSVFEPITFARYTGQESDEEKNQVMAAPPDILLTNYVMLELIQTRPDERRTLVNAAQGVLANIISRSRFFCQKLSLTGVPGRCEVI